MQRSENSALHKNNRISARQKKREFFSSLLTPALPRCPPFTFAKASSDENGWANLGPVGSNIVKQAPDFDPKNYRYNKLSELVTAIGLFTIGRQGKSILVKNERHKGN
jgi:hypothetical protein